MKKTNEVEFKFNFSEYKPILGHFNVLLPDSN